MPIGNSFREVKWRFLHIASLTNGKHIILLCSRKCQKRTPAKTFTVWNRHVYIWHTFTCYTYVYVRKCSKENY